MVKTGLSLILENFPAGLRNRRIGILCHAPSIDKEYRHITDLFHERPDCRLTAIFGPQHGMFGETQDNMIEWTGALHPIWKIPVYSLYGEHRKPTHEMLSNIDVLVIDLQDVGARLYTYAWTIKLCMEACAEANIPVWILDRPNPVSRLRYDGPVLKEDYFTFVGGAEIPLCHRMTLGEIAVWVREKHVSGCDLNIVAMKGWNRSMMYNETGLPWVIPSPNMPTLQSAVVYPGMVLFEAMNISEGRGTTIPFELFGAPFVDVFQLIKTLEGRDIPGCRFRVHNFIPTFNKFKGLLCNGLQLHVTNTDSFRPVATALEIIDALIETSPPDAVKFNPPPYEYEYNLFPFDILSGDDRMRKVLGNRESLKQEKERWNEEIDEFRKEFRKVALYKE
ncbi:MAG TPA: DUF1343 domain-containing protein [Bacteroidales bacterium]|nr:DUF1343 domain-containing protein [Bacteroidales bacterium]